MTTIIIDENTKKGKIILDLVRELKAGRIITEDSYDEFSLNKTTIEAIREAREGMTIVCEDFKEYLKKVSV